MVILVASPWGIPGRAGPKQQMRRIGRGDEEEYGDSVYPRAAAGDPTAGPEYPGFGGGRLGKNSGFSGKNHTDGNRGRYAHGY